MSVYLAKADSTYDDLMLKSGKYSLVRLQLSLARDKDVSTWTRAIAHWMAEHSISTIPLVQLQQAVQMPLVQLWFALLLREYAIEQRGEFCDAQQIWAFVGYPILLEEQIVGVIAMFTRHPIPSSNFEALEFAAHEIALGIRRKQAEVALPYEVAAKLVQRMNVPELSDREQEVVRQMALGLSNHDIGVALNITESTVKFHINRILSKLGVSNRTQAVITALKRGLAKL